MAKETLTVSGTIRVRHTREIGPPEEPKRLPEISPLAGVAVRVHAKKRDIAIWREIGVTVTDSNGRFSVSSPEREADWRFRIEVRLKGDDLVVRQHTHADWDTVLEQPEPQGEDLTGVTLTLGGGGPSAQDPLNDRDNRERAEAWVIARRTLDTLRDVERPFRDDAVRPFRLEIVAPADATFANPATRNVHLERGETFLTIIHEIMHIWAYDHTAALRGGQGTLITSALGKTRTTHDPQEIESTAFHEGFAEFAAQQLAQIMFGHVPALPLNRAALAGLGLDSIAKLIRNDPGWRSILTTLVTPNLHGFEFGAASGKRSGAIAPLPSPPPGECRSPFTTFPALLAVFGVNERRGVRHRLSREEMKDLRKFLERVSAMLGGTMTGRADDFLRLFDPTETVEPHQLFCQ